MQDFIFTHLQGLTENSVLSLKLSLKKWGARRKRGCDGEMENALTIALS